MSKDVLAWALGKGVADPNGSVTGMAADDGNLEMLQLAHAHGLPWHRKTCRRLIQRDALKALQWVRDHGCPWGELKFHDSDYEWLSTRSAWKWAQKNGAGQFERLSHEDEVSEDEEDVEEDVEDPFEPNEDDGGHSEDDDGEEDFEGGFHGPGGDIMFAEAEFGDGEEDGEEVWEEDW